MKSKILIVASLGLLLLGGAAMADRTQSISPRSGPDQDVPRENSDSMRKSQSSQDNSQPVHLHGVMRASRNQGFSVAGQRILLGADCGIFPVPDPGRLPNPRSWSGREVTVFGFRTRAGIDARLLILDGADGGSGRRNASANQYMIPSTSDPSVGVQRNGTPG
jgi:hypothetical protein